MKTILVADDEYSILEVLKTLLEDEGFAVLTASHGKEALTRVEENAVDLVLADVMMPLMDGRQLLATLRSRDATRTLPVVLMSAVVVAVPENDPRSAFLRKPFDLDTLLGTIRRLLAD